MMIEDLRQQAPVGITVRLEERVLHIVFDRPERRNALDLNMWTFIPKALDFSNQSDKVRAVSFSATDATSFSAGADISEFTSTRVGRANVRRYSEAVRFAETSIFNSAKPTVAFVRGYCIGGGCEIAVACDVRIGDTTAKMGITPSKLGIVYGLTSTARLVQEIGPGWARYLLQTADIIDSEVALRAGLLQFSLPADEAVDFWRSHLRRLTAAAPITLAGTKRFVERSVIGDIDEDQESAEWGDRSAGSEEYRLGVQSFLTKERPDFSPLRWPDK